MNGLLSKHRTAITVSLAVAVAAWAGGIAQLPSSAQTTTSQPPSSPTTPSATATTPPLANLPSGPPAPDGFATTVKRIYANAASYAGLPGKGVGGQVLTTAAPMGTDAFNHLIDSLTPMQLNQLYDYKPDAWPQVDAALSSYTEKVSPSALAAKIGTASAAAASLPAASSAPAPAPALAPGGADYAPPEPETFTPASCPQLDFGADDGYDLLFALDEAHDIAEIPAQPAYGFPSSIAAGVIAALISVAYALEIPPQTVEMLIFIATFCTTGDSEAEKDVLNHNLVNLDNTSIALLALDNQVHDLEGQIQQLLDTRTQTAVTKLNTAQASLDNALRQSIEESLQGGGATTIASYELPASLGGYLDSTPIGVQVIVTNAIATLQRANQPVNPTATSTLSSANGALAAGQYKQAFVYYQSAYQALTK
jgi:hypothetical protein